MKTTDKLFKLIKSLDKQEKRYFKLFAARHTIKGSNNYIKLFDAIARQKDYDEEQIKKSFGDEVFVKNLSASKYYLHNLILKSLHSYHAGSSVNAQIKEYMHYVEILFVKGLYDQCWGIIKKAKKLAYEYENNIQILEILRWEGKLLKIRNQFNNVYEEEAEVLAKLINFNEYDELGATVYNFTKLKLLARTKEQLKEIENVTKNPLLKKEELALSYEAKVKYYYVHSTANFILGDFKKSYEYTRKQVELIEANPHQITENPVYYIEMLNNLFIVEMEIERYDLCKLSFKKIREFPKKFPESQSIKARSFALSVILELILRKRTSDYSGWEELTSEMEDGLVKYEDLINVEELLIFNCRTSVLYFSIGNFTKALHWLNRALNSKDIEQRKDVTCFAKMLNLIIHFELGNAEYLEYNVKSTYNYLNKKDWLFNMETLIINFIKFGSSVESEKDREKLTTKLTPDLNRVRKDPYKDNAMYYFDFLEWIEGKLKELSVKI